MFKKIDWLKLLALLLVLFTFNCLEVDAAGRVRVKGYYRKDGTYVRPHYRTAPDGNPYNNYSYPGNYNPNTGKVTTGNPSTYLQRYYNRSSSTSSSVPTYNQSYRLSPSKNVKELRFNWYEWKELDTDNSKNVKELRFNWYERKGLDTNKLRQSNKVQQSSYGLDQRKTALAQAQNKLAETKRELRRQQLAYQEEIRKLEHQLAALKAKQARQQAEYKTKYNTAIINDDYELALIYSHFIHGFDEKRRNALIRLSNSK